MDRRKIDEISYVTRAQMMQIDALMIDEYNISLLQMMENAGRNLADLIQHMMDGEVKGKHVAVLCGGGNNGGGGMAAARHLANRGAHVEIALAVDESNLKEVPAHQLHALRVMGVEISHDFPVGENALYIDALIGYGLSGTPRGKIADWIEKLNKISAPVLSLDVPSGLDADSGEPLGACVRATATLTLALPKIGMLNGDAGKYLGELYLGDINVPVRLLREIGIITQPLFSETSVIKIE